VIDTSADQSVTVVRAHAPIHPLADIDCTNAHCTSLLLDVHCPSDAYLPTPYIPDGQCCPVNDQCRCLPGICHPPICPSTHRLHITRKGTGLPGSCCDQFQVGTVLRGLHTHFVQCEPWSFRRKAPLQLSATPAAVPADNSSEELTDNSAARPSVRSPQ
jgi:hypothetical protein